MSQFGFSGKYNKKPEQESISVLVGRADSEPPVKRSGGNRCTEAATRMQADDRADHDGDLAHLGRIRHCKSANVVQEFILCRRAFSFNESMQRLGS